MPYRTLSTINFFGEIQQQARPNGLVDDSQVLFSFLCDSLYSLDGIKQSLRHHPEEDTLFHSLQVFQLALADTDDPELLAAALFHDIGKSISTRNHAEVGADQLIGIFSDHVVWLIRHHLALLVAPHKTRKRLRHTAELAALEQLRRWDLKGRDPFQWVMSVEDAVERLLTTYPRFLNQSQCRQL